MRFIELEEDRTLCFKYITMMCRILGLVVVVFLYIMMISILTEEKYHTINGWYLLGITILLTFLELVWLFDKCCNCCNDMSCCCMVWRGIKWIDCWRKSILYVALPIPLFLRNTDQGDSVLKAALSGAMIIGLGLAYFIKSFRNTAFAKTGQTARSYLELQGDASSQVAVPTAPATVTTGTVPQQQQQKMMEQPPGPATALTSGSPAPPAYVMEASPASVATGAAAATTENGGDK